MIEMKAYSERKRMKKKKVFWGMGLFSPREVGNTKDKVNDQKGERKFIV